MQQIGVHRVGRLGTVALHLDRDPAARRIVHQLLAREQIPFAPGRDDLDIRVQRIGGQLEADLVVALAGRAVRDGVGTGLGGDLDQTLADQGPRDRGPEQILAFVDRVGAEHGEDEIAHELLAEIVDIDLLHTRCSGLGARRLELLALADVRGEGHDLAAVLLLQPLENDRGIQTPGVGQHHLLDCALRHRFAPTRKSR